MDESWRDEEETVWTCIECGEEWKDSEIDAYEKEYPLPEENPQVVNAIAICPDCSSLCEISG